jgi:hypothetical protein
MNSYNTMSKSPLAHQNHLRCTEIHKECYIIPCYVNGKLHQTSIFFFRGGRGRHATNETTDNCKITDKSKCASNGYLAVYRVILQLIKF